MSDAEKGCFPSVVTIMRDTGLSNTSVARHLRHAIEEGLLVSHRFRDAAGHCAGTNYYPRFPEAPKVTLVEEPPVMDEPACVEACEDWRDCEACREAEPERIPPHGRRSPWSNYPVAESLSENPAPREVQSPPKCASFTNNLPIEPSNRKLLQHALDENHDQDGVKGPESIEPSGKPGVGRDETEIAFVAWMQVAERLSIPAYASQLTVARRSLLRKTLSSMGGLEAWTAILERLPKARFLLGQGKRGFWISLEALCSENIQVRLLEGAYDRVPDAPKPAKPVQIRQVSVERWRERVKNWITAGKAAIDAWPASWGPSPGTEGCLVPAECLASLAA